MKNRNLLILGDSTSLSYGLNSENWTQFLYNDYKFESNLKITEVASPGNTFQNSFAILSWFIFHRKKVNFCIVHLGNCEQIYKPYSTSPMNIFFWISLSKICIFKKSQKIQHEWPKRNPFTWNSRNRNDFSIERQIRNSKYWLNAIILLCKFFRIKLLLIKPKSSKLFYPSTADTNSIFFKIYGSTEIIYSKILKKEYFLEHLKFIEEKQYRECRENLIQILKKHKLEPDLKAMLLNNFGTVLALENKIEESLFILDVAENISINYKSLIKYNKYLICLNFNETKKYRYVIDDIMTEDSETYRISSKNSNLIFKAKLTKSQSLIDLNLLISEEDFADHCHVYPQANKIISASAINWLSKFINLGNVSPEIEVNPLSSEFMWGDTQNFLTSFKITSSDVENVDGINLPNLQDLDLNFENMQVENQIKNLLSYIGSLYIESESQPLAFDFGRVPEILTARLASFFYFNEKNVEVNQFHKYVESNRDGQKFNLFSSAYLNKFNKTINQDSLKVKLHDNNNNIFRLTSKVYETYEASESKFKSNYCLRLRTNMLWYLREGLRFGFHGRNSMKYNYFNYRTLMDICFIFTSISRNFNDNLSEEKWLKLSRAIFLLSENQRIFYEINSGKVTDWLLR